jgi:hypothetical protein
MSRRSSEGGVALFQVLVLVLIISTLLGFALQRSQAVVGTAAAMQARMDFAYQSRTIEALALTRLLEGPGARLPLEAFPFEAEDFAKVNLRGSPVDLGEGASLAIYDLTGIPPVTLTQHPVWDAFAFSASSPSGLPTGLESSRVRACRSVAEAFALAVPLCERLPELFPHAAFSVAGEFNLAHLPESLARDLFQQIQDSSVDEAPLLADLQSALRNRFGARYQTDVFLSSTQPVEPLLVIHQDDGEHRFKARVHVILAGVDGEAFTVLRRSGF